MGMYDPAIADLEALHGRLEERQRWRARHPGLPADQRALDLEDVLRCTAAVRLLLVSLRSRAPAPPLIDGVRPMLRATRVLAGIDLP